MIAAPDTALGLLLRMRSREEADGGVIVAFHPIAPLLRNACVSEALASRLQAAQ